MNVSAFSSARSALSVSLDVCHLRIGFMCHREPSSFALAALEGDYQHSTVFHCSPIVSTSVCLSLYLLSLSHQHSQRQCLCPHRGLLLSCHLSAHASLTQELWTGYSSGVKGEARRDRAAEPQMGGREQTGNSHSVFQSLGLSPLKQDRSGKNSGVWWLGERRKDMEVNYRLQHARSRSCKKYWIRYQFQIFTCFGSQCFKMTNFTHLIIGVEQRPVGHIRPARGLFVTLEMISVFYYRH